MSEQTTEEEASLDVQQSEWRIKVYFELPRHRDLLVDANQGRLSTSDLEKVIAANWAQDLNQRDSALHFDNCCFGEGLDKYGYWWGVVQGAPSTDDALVTFGKLTHLVQDFYSHSNWVESHEASDPIPRWDMNMASLPVGIVSGTYWLGRPKRCTNGAPSHGDLNKDDPNSPAGQRTVSSGPNAGRSLYELAYDAANRHTAIEFARFLAARGNA